MDDPRGVQGIKVSQDNVQNEKKEMLYSIDINQSKALIMSGLTQVPQAPKNNMIRQSNRQIPYNNMMKKLAKQQDYENSTVLQSNSYSVSMHQDQSPARFNDTSGSSQPGFNTTKIAKKKFVNQTSQNMAESPTPNRFDDTVSKIKPKATADPPQNIITFKRIKSRISKGRVYSAVRKNSVMKNLELAQPGAIKCSRKKSA